MTRPIVFPSIFCSQKGPRRHAFSLKNTFRFHQPLPTEGICHYLNIVPGSWASQPHAIEAGEAETTQGKSTGFQQLFLGWAITGLDCSAALSLMRAYLMSKSRFPLNLSCLTLKCLKKSKNRDVDKVLNHHALSSAFHLEHYVSGAWGHTAIMLALGR